MAVAATAVVAAQGLAGGADRPPSAGVRSAVAPVVEGCLSTTGTCYAPQVLRRAYSITPLLDKGIDGRGRTVAVLLEQGPPIPGFAVTNIFQDIAAYDSYFRLPAAKLHVVTTAPGEDARLAQAGDEVIDVELVHAVAPGATIRVVLVGTSRKGKGTTEAEAEAAVARAVRGADVVVYGGLPERCYSPAEVAGLRSWSEEMTSWHITLVAGSGDTGAAAETCNGLNLVPAKATEDVSLPASDPLWLGVGGSVLRANPSTGAYTSEVAWSGSGGGFSHLFSRPSYQDGVTGDRAYRGVPDVASDAGLSSSVATVVARYGQQEVWGADGTSASAPVWAGVIALADQYAGRDLGFVNPSIYRIGESAHYHAAFHDITEGNNGVLSPTRLEGYQAGPGWDPVTGWGTPVASVLVPLLAHDG